ncbi:YtzH-like family protein [Lederbergia citrea]|uniref:YtzH-like family protein n=1 Tax=Lederbergia citrea TaxID=2833581 RepID=A0A942UPZ8_9BACI|nr:YtzH-like family protein [Lederbergia citrea]MBS4175974.1 YtzH-like family protein [Lederbergia citrea]MBS4202535.1 YtzH-like family protein [Lederbergia citrea]MBS4222798.1 YtzH-like family protein [Lederbergia citrea]
MPLSHHDQVHLLQDILVNHLEDCCGSVSECEQLGRLVKSLLVNQSVAPEMQPLLENIYAYCQTGKNTADLDNHINAHQEELSQWVGQINNYSI